MGKDVLMGFEWKARLGALLTVCMLAGCSSFQPSGQAQSAFEQTRQQMASGQVRPASYEHLEEVESIADHGLSFEAFSPEAVSEQILTAAGRGVNPEVARQKFQEAQQLYAAAAGRNDDGRNDAFLAAAGAYKQAAARWPNSAVAQDSLYWAGQAYFFADHYPKANEQFELLLKQFPNSKYLDAVEARRFSIAMYWLALDEEAPQSVLEFNFSNQQRPMRDTHGSALRILDRIRIDDPRGKLADDATLAAGNAHFRAGNFLKADEYYTDLRETFPSSEHQFNAHLLGMQAKIRSYRGADYSGLPLDEAEKLVEQMRKQFPNDANQQRDLLARSFARIRLSKAERKWSRAQYHDRRGEYRASKMFYDEIVKDFAETPYAAQAQARSAAVAGLPPAPETQFDWLVDAFPKHESQGKPLLSSNPLEALRR